LRGYREGDVINKRQETANEITGGVFFNAVIQGRNITVQLPPEVVIPLAGLPQGSPAFTGRQTVLDSILDVLNPASSDTQLTVAISGLPGAGKTELAIQAARAALARGWFPGGALFVDLLGHDFARRVEPGAALETLLRALGIPFQDIPLSVPARARLYASALATYANEGRRILLVIDNASDARQIMQLLPSDGISGVMVTSRTTLAALDARLFDLDVLSPSESVELIERALHVSNGSSDTRVSADLESARTVAGLCGYLPLALRIVAALMASRPALTMAHMAVRLAGERTRFDELQFNDLRVNAAFDLSYRELDEEQARLFRLVSVNPGPDISTETATVLMGGQEVRRTLEALARTHLIAHGSRYGRWQMHDLVRLYSQEHGHATAANDGRKEAFASLLNYYLACTRMANDHLDPSVKAPATDRFPRRDAALEWLDNEHLNLTSAAYAAGDGHPAIAVHLVLSLGRYLYWRRRFDEQISLIQYALEAARRVNDRDSEARLLNSLGTALQQIWRTGDAINAYQKAADIFRGLDDRHGEGTALGGLASALRQVRGSEEAIITSQQNLLICQELGDRHGEATALTNLGLALWEMRRFDEAIVAHREAVQIFRDVNDQHGEGVALTNLSIAMRYVHRHNEAIEIQQAAISIFRELGDRLGEAVGLLSLSRSFNRPDQAFAAQQKALSIFLEIGDRHGEAYALFSLVVSLWQSRRYDEARLSYQNASEILRAFSREYGVNANLLSITALPSGKWEYGPSELLLSLLMVGVSMAVAATTDRISDQLDTIADMFAANETTSSNTNDDDGRRGKRINRRLRRRLIDVMMPADAVKVLRGTNADLQADAWETYEGELDRLYSQAGPPPGYEGRDYG
jgi:tetratricopeptide (TPR) repeat protein